MRKMIAAMKTSLDGKMEGPEGYADWVDGWSDDYGITERIDTCLLGARMYTGYEAYWTAIRNASDEPLPMTGKRATEAERAWSLVAEKTPHYVLSSTRERADWPNTHLLRSLDEVAALKAKPGKAIYLMGGQQLTSSLMEAGLVDELHLIVYPLIAGEGRSLFAGTTRRSLQLLQSHSMGDGRVATSYALGG